MKGLSFEEILSPLLEAPGAIAAAFVDAHGQSIATVGDAPALEVIGAFQPVWTSGVAGIAAHGGLGPLEDVEIDFDERRLLAAPVKEGYHLLVLFERDGVPSVARSRVGTARERLAAEME